MWTSWTTLTGTVIISESHMALMQGHTVIWYKCVVINFRIRTEAAIGPVDDIVIQSHSYPWYYHVLVGVS